MIVMTIIFYLSVLFLISYSLTNNYLMKLSKDYEKQIITCDKNGKEKSRENEYSMGGGRMEFEDDGTIVWKDSMESTPGSNRFTKQNK